MKPSVDRARARRGQVGGVGIWVLTGMRPHYTQSTNDMPTMLRGRVLSAY